MTRNLIAQGLEELVLRLANNEDLFEPPAKWQAHEWAYVKGIASGEILRLRDRLVAIAAEHTT